jgi:hypothetical protein
MNRHLRDEMARTAPGTVRHAETAPQSAPQTRRPWSWRTWTVLAGILFGLYVFAGHFVLRPELQWSTISGGIDGRKAAAATNEASDAEADKAGKVATQTEQARVEPAIEIASAAAAIEVDKAAKLAQIEVEKQDKLNRLAAVQNAATISASSYTQCMERAQGASETAAVVGHTTFGAREVARQMALARAQAACEPLMTKQEQADEAAAAARTWAEQNK